MREKVGKEGIIRSRFEQHGYDLTWYVDGLFKAIDVADSRAGPNVNMGALRLATLRAYNESLLGWEGYNDKCPLASVQISPVTTGARKEMLYTDAIIRFMFENHEHLSKLGITYEMLMEYPIRVIADLRAAIGEEIELQRKRKELAKK